MAKLNLVKLGSNTARGGFKNEDAVVSKFNDWKEDADAQEWLKIMGYDLKEIEKVIAIKVHGYKTDVQVQITIYLKDAISAENLSVKLVSNPRGFNQVDKRWVDSYIQMWDVPAKVATALKIFTGETKPNKSGRDSRRLFLDEMNKETQKAIVDFFKANKILIITDILKGRGKLSAGWMLVALKNPMQNKRWILKSINHALNVFGNGEVEITERGSLKIGKITMQRKGGDAGRDTCKMLQFKINPVELFNN
ncbi:MAG: type II restriction endonuclease [Candidatus Nealsonbacteria bacterium]|nr:type II restriction endonuclease [Candidatus Nealsonbacteria bacterium]